MKGNSLYDPHTPSGDLQTEFIKVSSLVIKITNEGKLGLAEVDPFLRPVMKAFNITLNLEFDRPSRLQSTITVSALLTDAIVAGEALVGRLDATHPAFEEARLALACVHRAKAYAHESAFQLECAISEPEKNSNLDGRSRTSPAPIIASSARRIIDITMLALPQQHRSRYTEELQSELSVLAAMRATNLMQIIYALQQAGRMWQVRAALQDPNKRRCESIYRLTCWLLSSDMRTWAVLAPLTVAALFDIVAKQGWGSAILAAPTAWGFYQGAHWLRKRLGVTVSGGGQSRGDS
ncbi:hypothetical protein [Nonomuraea fuscirosea]|uniref:hypothetical protein n=1 Tax=Nonomuraea fuscirosea TaxID=1291556 RepID=UPI0033D9BD8F